MKNREVYGLNRNWLEQRGDDGSCLLTDICPPRIGELPEWIEMQLGNCSDPGSRQDLEFARIFVEHAQQSILAGDAVGAANAALEVGQYLARWEARPRRLAASQNRKDKGDLSPEQWQQVVNRVDKLAAEYRRAEAARLVRTEIMRGRFGPVANIPSVNTIRKKKLE